jgi:nucleoside-diphosphate-sugar epimerase
MRTLILGGTSFVGGALLSHLLGAGHDVTVLNRGRTAQPPPGVAHLVADRHDPASMRAALAGTGWDAVVDVSGFVKAAGSAAGFADLLGLLDGRVGRYVFVSSIMAYEPDGIFGWTEDHPLRDEPPTTYGGFKVAAERALLDRHATSGFPATIARPAAIYGPGNNIYDMEAAMFTRLRRGRPVLLPHGGLVTTSYGHVDDLCRALTSLCEHPAAVGEAFNVTGCGVTSGQYVRTLAEIVGVEPDVVAIGDDAVAALERPAFGHLFAARHHGMLDCRKASRLLGLEPSVDFRTGHEQAYAWFRSSPLAGEGETRSDPLWGAGFDLGHEARVAGALR